jgi:hypothetical protein
METVTVWFYLLGHRCGSFVAPENIARRAIDELDVELVRWSMAKGDHSGKGAYEIPSAVHYNGASWDHYN